jgi:hypothetical protein
MQGAQPYGILAANPVSADGESAGLVKQMGRDGLCLQTRQARTVNTLVHVLIECLLSAVHQIRETSRSVWGMMLGHARFYFA